MSKEISMSIPDFMRVQRKEITYKDLDDSEISILDELLNEHYSMEKLDKFASIVACATISSVTIVKILEAMVPMPIVPLGTVSCMTTQQIDGDLIKEGIEVLYYSTSKLLEYTYRLMKAITINM